MFRKNSNHVQGLLLSLRGFALRPWTGVEAYSLVYTYLRPWLVPTSCAVMAKVRTGRRVAPPPLRHLGLGEGGRKMFHSAKHRIATSRHPAVLVLLKVLDGNHALARGAFRVETAEFRRVRARARARTSARPHAI